MWAPLIAFVHSTQGSSVQYNVAPLRSALAYRIAFSSAWIEIQFSYEILAGCSSYVNFPRGQAPAVAQPNSPAGAPLYPVEMMRLSIVMTHPTIRRVQSARSATVCAIARKYSSHSTRGTDILGHVFRPVPYVVQPAVHKNVSAGASLEVVRVLRFYLRLAL